jgi:hypothetical protein
MKEENELNWYEHDIPSATAKQLYIPVELFKETFKELLESSREYNAIISVYRKERHCIPVSDTCKDFNIDYNSVASSIIYVIEDYFRIKKETKRK